MTKENLILFGKFLDDGCDLLGDTYIESKTEDWLRINSNDDIFTKLTEKQKLIGLLEFILKDNLQLKESTINDICESYIDSIKNSKS